MKIPYSVRVDRETYRVEWSDPDRDGCGESTEDGSLGSCDTDRRLIKLAPRLRKDRRLRVWTFWHELAHAWDWEFSLGLAHTQIDRLGRALAYMAEDNGLQFPGKPAA